jgi:hypothetical protein
MLLGAAPPGDSGFLNDFVNRHGVEVFGAHAGRPDAFDKALGQGACAIAPPPYYAIRLYPKGTARQGACISISGRGWPISTETQCRACRF